MLVSTIITWPIFTYILTPLNVLYLKFIVFILVIASTVQLIDMFLKKYNEQLHKAFGIYLPLITTNCAILGVVILTFLNNFNIIEALIFALGSGIGFLIALLIMSGIRERLSHADVPASLRGVPIALIIAGLLALAFGGFSGIL
jgi:electron transport complex protein RnfA